MIVLRTAHAAETFRLYADLTAEVEGLYGPRAAGEAAGDGEGGGRRGALCAHPLLPPGGGGAGGGGSLAASLLAAPHPPTYRELVAACTAARTPTVSDAWGLALTSLDGVGPEAAAAVVAAAPTPAALVTLLAGLPAGAAARMLAGLHLPSSSRRVGPVAAAAIVSGLFGAGTEGLGGV
jgi:hypothetical protein